LEIGLIATMLLVLQLASAAPDASVPDCSETELAALSSAQQMIGRGDDAVVVAPGACDFIRLARSSLLGWREARGLAAKGGEVALLGPVNQYLGEIRAITHPSLAIEVEYAEMAVRAAIAAAQDERAEMELLLQQARDLSERLARRQRRAMWPRPFNLLAGDLWFEVDRYEEAAAAFERATRFDGTAAAYAGLGRALAALGRRADACRAYKQVRGAVSTLQRETSVFLAGCP
jgi:tetratricopeptide (TPR) repeat protein